MEYTLKFKFSTVKPGRGGSVRGSGGNGECDITTDYHLDELKTKTDELKSIAYYSLNNNTKVKKMGSILSIDIIDVVIKSCDHKYTSADSTENFKEYCVKCGDKKY